MKCERARLWFSDLIDGSIQPAQRVVLEAHLAACAACAEEVRSLRAVWSGLDAMPSLEPPATLRATIWQRIEAHQTQADRSARRARPSWFTGWVRVTTVTAGAVALLALATVSVPGRFRSAGWTSWIPGVHRSTSKPPALHVTGTAQTESGDRFVAVTLRASAVVPAADVIVTAHGAEIGRSRVALRPPETTVRVPVAAATGPIEVRVEIRQSQRALTLIVPVR